MFWAAGFSFSKSQLIKDCGYQSDFTHVFFGEEQFQMYKMWKKGYQLFTPTTNVCSHLWTRSQRAHSFEVTKQSAELQLENLARMKSIMLRDKEYVDYMKAQVGLDIENSCKI